MKYWTLFFTRMMARVGLVVVVVVCVAEGRDLSGPFDDMFPIHARCLPGLEYRQPSGGWGHMLHFDHWLITLTFLIATVATSWRRKPKDVRTEGPIAEAVTQTE